MLGWRMGLSPLRSHLWCLCYSNSAFTACPCPCSDGYSEAPEPQGRPHTCHQFCRYCSMGIQLLVSP